MTTFFGRRIDAMYQGCSRSSLVAVSTRERAIKRTFYELCIKGWIPEFFVSSPSFEGIKVRSHCYWKQLDNNFPWPTIFFTITEQFLARPIGRELWSIKRTDHGKDAIVAQFVFPFLAQAIFRKLRLAWFHCKVLNILTSFLWSIRKIVVDL